MQTSYRDRVHLMGTSQQAQGSPVVSKDVATAEKVRAEQLARQMTMQRENAIHAASERK